MRTAIPHATTATAFAIQGDANRLTSTLSHASTFAGLCAAEQAANRILDNARALKASVRNLKRQAKIDEAACRARDAVRQRDGMEIPA